MDTNEESAHSTRAGVIGLGIMGGVFAGHLTAAGVRTSGHDLLSACDVAAVADIVITSLPRSGALEDALFGDSGLVAAERADLLVVETSTLSLEDAPFFTAVAAQGMGLQDTAAVVSVLRFLAGMETK
jgi:3-hydroxyisobutyrate dehydrogenase-like beta-hydroxyacid dehydrogenase